MLPSPTVEFRIGNQTIAIQAFDSQEAQQDLHQQSVNIIASGPSIADLEFTGLMNTATIFVNGSINLLTKHDFTNVVGWVISDARFISHQPDIFDQYYTGQPLYATVAVLKALVKSCPSVIHTYHNSIRVIYPVDRPWNVKINTSWFNRLRLKRTVVQKKIPLTIFANQPGFVIDIHHKPAPIGLSLDITNGFVEAGTVAYIGAQLAFSRHAGAIHLYGIDLLNSNQPRFYEAKDNSSPSKLDKAVIDRIVPSFDLLGKTYRAHGVNVVNHSPVSKHLF